MLIGGTAYPRFEKHMDMRAAGPPGCSEGGVITSHAAFFYGCIFYPFCLVSNLSTPVENSVDPQYESRHLLKSASIFRFSACASTIYCGKVCATGKSAFLWIYKLSTAYLQAILISISSKLAFFLRMKYFDS